MKEAEGDKEMKELLEEDILRIMGDDENYGQIEEVQEEIIEQILPITKADQQNSCTVEIMQAAGGSESSLFAEEILGMYQNFCKLKGWRFSEEKFQEDM